MSEINTRSQVNKSIIKKHEQLVASKIENMIEMHKILEKHNLTHVEKYIKCMKY